MKNLLYISLLIMLVLSCKNPKDIDFSEENDITADTITEKNDIFTKISKPFMINGIECYWKVSIIMEQGDFEGGFIIRELIDNKTRKTILKDTDFAHIDRYKEIDFEEEKENFKDINFDGLKDFIVFNHSGTPLPYNFFYNIHIFDNSTKSFDFSEELSGTEIEIDSTNRKVISNYLYMGHSAKTIHYLDKNGKIKFTEVFREDSTTINDTVYTGKEYMKIINGKIVETKEDW